MTHLPSKMTLSIIGSGVVGGATGKGFVQLGHDVIFYDTEREKLRQLSSQGYKVCRNVFDAVTSSSFSFVCVQTPTDNGNVDLSFMKSAIVSIGKALKKKRDYHVVVVRSTLLPGTTRSIIFPILQRFANSRFFGLCYNPEFLRQTSSLEDFLNPSRIVIGELDEKSGNGLAKLYSPLNAPTIRTDFDTAEMIKHVSNAFLATKISFFNEIYHVCRKLGIDDKVVSEAVSLDPRIGGYGVVGGRPFAGGCLPKDVVAFAKFLEGIKVNPDIVKVVLEINSRMNNQ